MPLASLHPDKPDRILLSRTTWNEKELIRLLPGSWYKQQEWTVPLSWASCVALRGVFGANLEVAADLNSWAREERERRILPALAMREWTELPDGMKLITDLSGQLYPFQRAGVAWLLAAESGLLADDMGTGKTIEILTMIRERLARFETSLPALVICPNAVKRVWAREAETWLPEANVYVVEGTPAARNRAITAAADDPNSLLIVNFEALRTLSRQASYGSIRLKRCRECDPRSGEPDLTPARCHMHPRALNRIGFHTVIVDEAHRIKDPKSQQTRAVWALAHGPATRWRYATTGTPIANDPSDLWSPMHAVAPIEYPARSAFVDRYCLQAWTPYGTLDIVGVQPTTRDELYAFLDPRFRRLPKELTGLQLPPKVRQIRYVDLPPKARREYDTMDREMIVDRWEEFAEGDEEMVLSPGLLTKSLRLMQFASATVEVSGDRYRLTEPSVKVDELINIISDLPAGTSLVFAAESRQLIELASARLTKLGLNHGLITGSRSPAEREVALEDFQSGRTKLLGFTLKAGGTGLTMTAASVMVFLQRSWSLVENLQGEDRVHRIGSERHESVTIIDVVTRDTIEDERQIPALYNKILRLEEIRRDRGRLLAAGADVAHLDTAETALMDDGGSDAHW